MFEARMVVSAEFDVEKFKAYIERNFENVRDFSFKMIDGKVTITLRHDGVKDTASDLLKLYIN